MARDDRLGKLSETCLNSTTCEAVWSAALDFFHDHGLAMVSYLHIDPARADGDVVTIRADGYPDAWVCDYIGKKLYLIDPIPELAARTARPFLWSELRSLVDVTASGERYLAAREKAHLGDGLAVQTFGPNMRTGYFGLGYGCEKARLSALEIATLQCGAQIMHMRYCDLTPADKSARRILSPREKEILEWMARGKSNAVIAEILGLSRHTVDTLARRIFEKLDVNDRTTAAIRGLGSGLLQYQRVT